MSGLFEPAGGCKCASCLERAGAFEASEVWQARATQAEARVAELEAAAEVLAENRRRITGLLAAQTGETMRLRGATEKALELLGMDRPHAAADCLEKSLSPPTVEPDHA